MPLTVSDLPDRFLHSLGENVKGISSSSSSATRLMERSAVSVGGGVAGKHWILAELSRVEQDLTFLEKELEELEQTDTVSTVCEELVYVIEARPDPLLPLTNGPLNMAWDRWFEGPKGAHGCRCLIL